MENIYFTYRRIWDNQTNRYDVSYYNDLQYSDFKESWLTEMIDWDRFISEDRITKETYPGIKSLRRAWVLKFDPLINRLELETSLVSVASSFSVEILTAEQMATWIREYTNLVEETPNNFVLSEETTFNEQVIPKQILTIE